eukprot:symbB.v1.2.026912.t2/scaffold2728.1/size72050/3
MLPNERLCSVYAGHLGKEQMELHLSRARCWLALESAQRAVLDCNIALAICRCLAPLPPKRAPGFELTVPLLVLGMAMAFARQYTVGIVLCAGAFLWDYLAQQRAKRQAANADLAKVLALRGRSKLQQGLAGLAQNELRWANTLDMCVKQSKTGARKKPLLAPADAAQRTWRTAAADAVQVDGFLSSLNLECHGKALTLADAQAKGDDDRCQLGYMDYCGDGFNAMCGMSGQSLLQHLSPFTTLVEDRTPWESKPTNRWKAHLNQRTAVCDSRTKITKPSRRNEPILASYKRELFHVQLSLCLSWYKNPPN